MYHVFFSMVNNFYSVLNDLKMVLTLPIVLPCRCNCQILQLYSNTMRTCFLLFLLFDQEVMVSNIYRNTWPTWFVHSYLATLTCKPRLRWINEIRSYYYTKWYAIRNYSVKLYIEIVILCKRSDNLFL